MKPPQSSDCLVTRCLQDANEQLQKALDAAENDAAVGMEDAATNASLSPENHTKSTAKQDATMNDTDNDPDDLAAAFFAQQAKKKEAELKLPVEEWAKVIRRKKELVGSTTQQSTTSSPKRKGKSNFKSITVTLILCLTVVQVPNG